MSGTPPLDPIDARLARGAAPIDEKRKRDLQSTRLFSPGGRRGESIRVEAPEPTGQNIANQLSRLTSRLDTEVGVVIPDHNHEAVATSENPWRTLEDQLKRAGVSAEFSQVREVITELHEDQFRISTTANPARLRPDFYTLPGTGESTDDGAMYLAELNRLTTVGGLNEQQAHALLAEWGWSNPVTRNADPSLETLAEGLALMKATGEYTGTLEPEDLLSVSSLEAAFALVGEEWKGSLSETEGAAVLQTLPGIADSIEENRQLAVEDTAGRPVPDVVKAPDTRGFMGVHPDFVAKSAPRPPGPLRATRDRPGFDIADADAIAGSGPRGSDLAFAGSPGTTRVDENGNVLIGQLPEYRENDNYNIFNGLSFEQTMLYQTMLVDAGWLDAVDFSIEQGQQNGGFATWAAMETAMVAANRTISVGDAFGPCAKVDDNMPGSWFTSVCFVWPLVSPVRH